MAKLFDTLMANDKKGIFKINKTPLIGYPTGFTPLDFQNGYLVAVPDKKGKIVDHWANTGLFGGSFVTVIGNAGVAKTTFCVQAGSHIIRPFEMGEYYHIDAEGSSNISRIQTLNHFSIAEMEDKYKMPEIDYVEDAFKMIYHLAEIKLNDKIFQYDMGKCDEFGKPIIGIQPTIFLIDSLPSLQTKEVEDSDELGGQTYNMRLATAYNTFYKRLRPLVRKANITVFAINHIKAKPELPFNKTQAQVQYLKTNENIPGGTGPIYYSQTLLRFIYKGKYVMEKDGFNGFLVEVQSIKSKTNRGGASVFLVFDYEVGFDPWLTMLKYANDACLIKGRNPYSYFETEPDTKFNTKAFREAIKNKGVRDAMFKECAPSLHAMLSSNKFDPEKEFDPKELAARLDQSYQSVDVSEDTEVSE